MSNALSPLRRAELTQAKRAMSAPMIGAQMVCDPYIAVSGKPGADLMTRRACQYATAIARKQGSIPTDASALHAHFMQGKSTVYFMTTGPCPKVYASFLIPARVMEYDPDSALLCLPAPDGQDDFALELVDAREAGLAAIESVLFGCLELALAA